MEINIDARVITRDGKAAGRVSRVVMDPTTHDLLSLIVTTGGRIPHDLVIPLNVVHAANRDRVELRIDEWELERMPRFGEQAFAEPGEHWLPPSPYLPGAVLFPQAAPYGTSAMVPPPVVAAPPGSVILREGLVVLCLDGPCGTVDEVLTDVYRDRVTAFKVRKGHFFAKDVTVPVHLINEVSDEHVRVAATRDQLGHLPSLPPAAYLHEEGPATEQEHER